ncbi:hypothetical protein, partial [Staphylococcus warneri]|uniref:hypothetical protein n=1 Tax=Staphylococcus warneri TaxID=1292 RepID=UPI001C93098C
NLNNKETLLQQLQQLISLPHTCPISPNQITSLPQHIHFHTINKNQNLIQSLQKDLNQINIHKPKFQTTLNHLTHQINNIHLHQNT